MDAIYISIPLSRVAFFASLRTVRGVCAGRGRCPTVEAVQGWSAFQAWRFQGSMAPENDGQWGRKFVVQARDAVFADMLQVAGSTELIATPTLFVQPQQGLNRTAWQLRPDRRFIRNLQIESVPGKHWCFLVEPAAFNQVIQNFLIEQTSS